jgi:hypothetical protein
MEPLSYRHMRSRAERWIVMFLCTLVLLIWVFERFILHSPVDIDGFAPFWLPIASTILAVSGIIQLGHSPLWLRIQRTLLWSGALSMLWLANGLIFDFLALAGLIGDPSTGQRISVDHLGMVTRILALCVTAVLAHTAFAHPASQASINPATWYGYAAFALALPYPVMRIYWALGGTVGLMYPSGAGHGFAPLLLAIPWILAAAISLLLISPPHWIPRRLLLTAGCIATIIVASIAPAACWSLITKPVIVDSSAKVGIATWVFGLFYGSWLLWAITAGAASRSYQLRTTGFTDIPASRANVEETKS